MDTEPLHRRIASDIERRIASGEWEPGFRIPTEVELMAEYGCARMTVSRAITDLAARSLVVRRRRAGTVVAHPPVHSSALVAIPDIQSEVEGRGLKYSHTLLARIVRPAADDEELGEKVVELATLHLSDDVPFVFERRLIGLDAAPDAENADFAAQPPGSWLLANMPWTEAEHRISAIAADGETAHHLGLADGTACLRLERRTWRDGQGVTRATQIFPGTAYDLVARFSPTKG
ncbi:MAG: UTRA domain-containing protein [Janthinobacterium lividum]|uniref:UTRA domain-containing protein n=1 Tax=unclassified Brevundimonas TaxID=2622653 RepID=UPI0025C5360C|nr:MULTISPECIES: UTRA domain-containing protein [unclassified Brevundimonas]